MKFKKAFTLSELLIALVIIGIVAALTIPALIKNYQQKQWEVAKKVFTGKLYESLKLMNTQKTLSGYKSTENFLQNFQKYYSITKICDNKPTDCFSDIITWGETEIDLTTKLLADDIVEYEKDEIPWGTKIVGIQISNGMSALIAYNPKCKTSSYTNDVNIGNCIAVIYDTNANANPNEYGKDIDIIGKIKIFFEAVITKVEEIEQSDTSQTEEPKPEIEEPKEEPQPIQEEPQQESTTKNINGVKFKSLNTNYGCVDCSDKSGPDYKYCNTNWYGYQCDYYGGAVKSCGGIENVATKEDLEKIAQYVYGQNSSRPGFNSGSKVSDKATEIGIPEGDFYVWSAEATDDRGGFQYFSDYGTASFVSNGGTYRYAPGRAVICVEH